MEYQAYLNSVANKLNNKCVYIMGLATTLFYQEVFRWEWMATKLKISVFVSKADRIDETIISNYSKGCMDYAMKNHMGLPIGFQNGDVAFAVLSSKEMDKQAVDFALRKPRKHYAAMEVPVIYDLNHSKAYYYQDTPIWGAMYSSYLRTFIKDYLS